MEVTELSVPGAWVFTPRQFPDDRGSFCEWYKADVVAAAVGHRLDLVQANHSVSRRGVLRGLHYALVPPGQAKYVYCPQGEVVDVVVDIRPGSPTFGRHDTVRLDAVDRRAVYLSEGLGHAFLSLADGSNVAYLCSTAYNPGREKEINPLDPALGLDWVALGGGHVDPLLSDKDRAAPTLAEAVARGTVTPYAECVAYAGSLRTSGR